MIVTTVRAIHQEIKRRNTGIPITSADIPTLGARFYIGYVNAERMEIDLYEDAHCRKYIDTVKISILTLEALYQDFCTKKTKASNTTD